MVVVDGRLLLMAAACSPSSPGSTILTSRPTRNKALKIIIGVSNFVKKVSSVAVNEIFPI